MTKSMTTSLFIHGLLLLMMVAAKDSPSIPEVEPQQAEIQLTEAEENKDNVQIKEIGEDGQSENLNFYWGLGISTSYLGNKIFVTEVHPGYNGEAAGLKVGDIITLINDKEISEEDIRGNGPQKLKLTIWRNSGIIVIHTERGKVYY